MMCIRHMATTVFAKSCSHHIMIIVMPNVLKLVL